MKNSELSRNQARAVQALLANSTIAEAALACDLTERTLYNYLADDDFRAALRVERDKLTAHLAAALAGQAADALTTLMELHKDKETPPTVRRAAARDIVAERRKVAELDDLAERVERLEERYRYVEAQN